LLVSLHISHSYLFDLEGYWTIGQVTSLGAELPHLSFFAFSCSTTLKWVSSFSLSHPSLHSPLHMGPHAVLDWFLPYDSNLHMCHSGIMLHLVMTHFPWLSYDSHLAVYPHQHYESLGLCILTCFQGLCSLPLHFR